MLMLTSPFEEVSVSSATTDIAPTEFGVSSFSLSPEPDFLLTAAATDAFRITALGCCCDFGDGFSFVRESPPLFPAKHRTVVLRLGLVLLLLVVAVVVLLLLLLLLLLLVVTVVMAVVVAETAAAEAVTAVIVLAGFTGLLLSLSTSKAAAKASLLFWHKDACFTGAALFHPPESRLEECWSRLPVSRAGLGM